MDDEDRLRAVTTMLANAVTLMTASLSGAMGEVLGGLVAGVGGAVGAALGGEGAGEEAGREISKDVSVAVRDLVVRTQAETVGQLEKVLASLTPAEKEEVFREIRDESYDVALRAVEEADFGLPRLTEKMPAEELARYLALGDDPRLGEVIRQILSVKPPKAFEAMKAAAGGEERAEPPPPEPLPDRITKLPATYLFPPGAEAPISLRGRGPVWIRWEARLGPGDLEKVRDHGFQIRDDSGSAVSSLNGSAQVRPKRGRIGAVMKNLESFPMAAEIRAEPDEG